MRVRRAWILVVVALFGGAHLAGAADIELVQTRELAHRIALPPAVPYGTAPRDIKLGTTFRNAAWPIVGSGLQRVPLVDGNSVTLVAGEQFNWGSTDTGIQLSLKPTRLPVAYKESYKRQYFYLSRAAFEDNTAVVTLADYQPVADEALLLIRNVDDAKREWRSAPIVVPKRARLTAAYGLVQVMPGEETRDFDFSVSVLDESGEETILRNYQLNARQPEAEIWNEVQFNFSVFAGKTVSVVLRAQPVSDAPLEASIQPVWSIPQMKAFADPIPTARPNIILISLDTARADRMSFLGYERETSPTLDALAKESTVFTFAVSPSTWTTPSHASIFTGALPWMHGAGSWYRHYSLAESWTTVAELARDAGYTTAAFTEGGAVSGIWGLAQGFEQYDDGPFMPAPRSGVARRTFNSAWSWLDREAAAPYFLGSSSESVGAKSRNLKQAGTPMQPLANLRRFWRHDS